MLLSSAISNKSIHFFFALFAYHCEDHQSFMSFIFFFIYSHFTNLVIEVKKKRKEETNIQMDCIINLVS